MRAVPWDDLWSRLCHQGTVYSASYAAVPTLARMSLQHTPSGYIAALQLAAAIIASNDGPSAAGPWTPRPRSEDAASSASGWSQATGSIAGPA
jgi:hypothetical protein